MKRNQDCRLKDVGGQALLVPVGAKVRDLNALITLNATGRRVWELLAEDRTAEALVAAIAAEFDVDPGRVRADVLAFLERLGRLGLIEP
jgi:hypothetical protein